MANIREAEALYSDTDVTLTTTTEGVIITSPLLTVPADVVRLVILAWAQLLTGADTTDVRPRVRRGSAITGTLVGEANAEAIKVPTGNFEPFFMMVAEERAGQDRVQYSFTLQQVAASGNGIVGQASILVLAL